PNTANNTSSTTLTVSATSADLSVTKTGPAAAGAGSNVTYTITVTNNGPNDAQNVTLSDVLPATETFVSQSQTSFPDFCTLFNNGNNVSDTIATLPAGNTDTITITVTIKSTVASGTQITNRATISSSTFDPNTANNTSSTTLTVSATSADLSVTKTGPAAAGAGSNVTYTITVTNNGPNDAQNVTLSDVLPATETFVSQSQTGFPDFFTLFNNGNNVSDTIATLPAGNTDTITITVTIKSTVANGTQLTYPTPRTTDLFDPNTANNTS